MTDLLLIASRYLRKRPARSLFNMLAIAFGVAVLFATSSLMESMDVNLVNLAKLPGEPDVSLVRGAGESFEADPVLTAVANVEGVKAVTGVFRRSFAMPVPGELGMNIPGSDAASAPVLTLIGVDPDSAREVSSYPMLEGRFLEAGDEAVLIIPASLAHLEGINLGEQFPLLTPGGLRLFSVVGLLDDGGIPSIQMIVPLTEAQAVFDAPGQINAVDVAFSPKVERGEVVAMLLETLGEDYLIQDLYSDDESLVVSGSLNFFGVMALFLGAFIIFNTFRTAIAERQQDLAMLRALGAEYGQIIQVILFESLILGVVGAFLGLMAGAGLAVFLVTLAKNSGWVPGFDTLTLNLSMGGALLACSLGIGTALFASYFPARTAGKVSPLAALRTSRQEEKKITRWQVVAGNVFLLVSVYLLIKGEEAAILSGFCVLLAAVLLAPAFVRPVVNLFYPLVSTLFPRESDIARSNILRQPRRAAVVVNGLMVAFAVFTASAALIASFSDFFTWMYTSNYLSDVLLLPIGGETLVANDGALGADPWVADRILELPEVTAVSRLRAVDVMYQGEEINVLGIDPEHAGELRPLLLYEGKHDRVVEAMQSERALIANDRFAMRFGFQLGDTIQLNTPLKSVQRYTLVGIGDDIDIRPDQPGIMMANKWLANDFGASQDLILYVDLHDGADTAVALQGLKDAVRDFPQFVAVELSAFQEGAIRRGKEGAGFFYLMAIVVMVPSLLGLLNTLIINVLERKREIGMMRAIGSDREQVRRMFLAETLLLGLFGSLMGVFVGLALGASLVQLWNNALTAHAAMSPTIPVPAIAVGLVVGLTLSLLVSLLPSRYAANLDIVQAIRYE